MKLCSVQITNRQTFQVGVLFTLQAGRWFVLQVRHLSFSFVLLSRFIAKLGEVYNHSACLTKCNGISFQILLHFIFKLSLTLVK